MGQNLPVDMLAADLLLADKKLMYYSFGQVAPGIIIATLGISEFVTHENQWCGLRQKEDTDGVLHLLQPELSDPAASGRSLLSAVPAAVVIVPVLLADKKLMYYSFGQETVYDRMGEPRFPHLAEYNDGYLYDMRKLLKGDENMLGCALRQMREIPEKAGRIHYLTNYYGFTLDSPSAEAASGDESWDAFF